MGNRHWIRSITGFFCALAILAAGAVRSDAHSALPTGDVTFVATWNDYSNADITFSGLPSGLAVENKTYLGWCIDMNKDVVLNTQLTGQIVSPLDISFQYWSELLHILNNKVGGRGDVQLAIWYFTDGNAYLTAEAAAMVNAALSAGGSYTPGSHGVGVLVLVQANAALQDMIIEVPIGESIPPAPPEPEITGASPFTIGYWKNHQEHLGAMLELGPINLGDVTVTTVAEAIAVLKNSNAKDARNALRCQLLATILNLRNGSDPLESGDDIRASVSAAIQFLATYKTTVIDGKHPQRALAIELKDDLDGFNNL